MTTALVTGGTSGIGLAFARRLAATGHDLVLVARDVARLEQTADDLRLRYGVAVEVLVADLAVRAQVQRVADRVSDVDHPVDLLVNNAGYGLGQRFVGGDVEAEAQMLDVLCRAVLVLSHAGTGAMVARGHGAIVNVSSVAGWTAGGTYAAAKAWVTAFTEGLACELAGTGVTATALCPGYVRTGSTAGMRLPELAWLDVDDLVESALDDVRRGRIISVPSLRYTAVASAMRAAPRPLVRALTGSRPRRRR